MSLPLSVTSILVLQYFFASTITAQQNQLLLYPKPDLRPLKKALGYYEDSYLNFTELTTKYGYPTEEHTVITQDGYILTVFRVLAKCKRVSCPIILMHGILDSSEAFILSGPKEGLGYILADNCFDVWAANSRGNTYSRRHLNLDPDRDAQYWEYSFNEHGKYDLPAIIDYVIKTTLQNKICYISHSLGSTGFFVMASTKPEYNEKIQVSINLAPVAWLKYMRNPIFKLIAPKSPLISDVLKSIGIRELLAKHHLILQVTEFLCQVMPVKVCGTVLLLANGADISNFDKKKTAVIFGHLFDGMSVNILTHLAQLVVSQRFQNYDEGRKLNLMKYGTIQPPEYNVSLITSSVVLMSAPSDFLSDLKNVEILKSKLPNLLEHYVIPDPAFSHNDFLWNKKSLDFVYPKILDYLKNLNS